MAGTTADAALATLRQGLEGHDEQVLVGAYADDAVVIAYSEHNRPESAQRIEGRETIGRWMRDGMCSQVGSGARDE